jgi:AcrR family transcriptional regulator
MVSKSSPRRKTRDSLDAKTSERARIVAAFMGLLVEQSIRHLDFGQVAAGADVSIAQLREEFASTIDALTAHVEEMDCLVLSGAEVEMADRAHCLAMLLTSVLRAWLKGEDPNLARTMSAIERAGAWEAARRPVRPRLPHSGLQLPPTPQRRHRADQDKVGA